MRDSYSKATLSICESNMCRVGKRTVYHRHTIARYPNDGKTLVRFEWVRFRLNEGLAHSRASEKSHLVLLHDLKLLLWELLCGPTRRIFDSPSEGHPSFPGQRVAKSQISRALGWLSHLRRVTLSVRLSPRQVFALCLGWKTTSPVPKFTTAANFSHVPARHENCNRICRHRSIELLPRCCLTEGRETDARAMACEMRQNDGLVSMIIFKLTRHQMIVSVGLKRLSGSC